jgi:hypothetical protein
MMQKNIEGIGKVKLPKNIDVIGKSKLNKVQNIKKYFPV